MNILVVDDEKAFREGTRRTIIESFPEFSVKVAKSASEAIEVLLQSRIHIVFLDIMMPGLNGLELLAKVRSNYPNIKWIVVTAYPEFTYAQEALKLGARDYILKPFGKKEIVESVSQLKLELDSEMELISNYELLEHNLEYLREAVFRRWAQGLDIGRFDLTEIKKDHSEFYLLAIKLESNQELTLNNFVVENVMSEYINMKGKGFIVSLDGNFLVGVVTMYDDCSPDSFQSIAVQHLNRCLNVPYQFYLSSLLTDFDTLPDEIKKLSKNDLDYSSFASLENNDDVIDIAIQYIRNNFKENLTLKIVASVIFLNPIYFSKLFKQKTGFGFKEFVTKLRMEHAIKLLLETDMTITKVGELVGYPDVRHFTQVFRKNYDYSPGQYRED